ncbi:MAG: DUF3592 domain-containing protein [Nitrospirota bacterium]|nr:DUF3592 domain-containing protein [Nitrospirota bacterium]
MDNQPGIRSDSAADPSGGMPDGRPRPRMKTRLPSEREMEGRRLRIQRDKAEKAIFQRYYRLGALMLISPALYFIDAISSYVITVSGTLFLVGGGWGAWVHGKRFRGAQEREKWPSVEGTIVRSRLKQFPSSHKHSHEYLPDIEYHYTVRNKNYTGTNVRLGDSDDPLLESQHGLWAPVVARYPAGTPVRVYYNPEGPREACLEITESGAGLEMTLNSILALQGFFGMLTGLARMG